MEPINLRVFNFALLFTLALATTYFALLNTDSTTITLLPGASGSIPTAILVIISAGVGACGVWLFSSWSEKIRLDEIKEFKKTKNELEEMKDLVDSLQADLNKLKVNRFSPFKALSEAKGSSAFENVS